MIDFTLSPLASTIAEGGTYSFTVTPSAALAALTTVRWEIVANGKIPISTGDVSALTGTLNFASGTTAAQTFSFTATDDTALEATQNFEIRVYQVVTSGTDILIGSQDVSLTDGDTGSFGTRARDGTAVKNVLGAASTQGAAYNGGANDDTYIVTRFQYGDMTISDRDGTNLIKFDFGVTITDYDETSVLNGRRITKVDLTLDTGAVITITSPASGFNFQLGDGTVLTTYAALKTAIGASGTNSASALSSSHDVITFTTPPDVVGNAALTGTRSISGTGAEDVLGSANDFNLNFNGLAGDDVYVITRFQYGDVTIGDNAGSNLIKFDFGVTITDYDETSVFNGRRITKVALTLDTGAVITIESPAGKFDFQLGDDAVITTYAAFKTALDATGTNAASALASTFAVAHPAIPDSITTPVASDFTLSPLAVTVAEGGTYSFTISPSAALSSVTTARWEIVANGKIPISSGDVSALTGTLSFASGATAAQTISFTATDDTALETTQNFEIRVYQVVTSGTDTLIGSQDVSLTNTDVGDFGTRARSGTGDKNVLGAASTQGAAYDGLAGNDTYIITRFQYGDMTISDSVGTNLIKFDYGVTITGYAEISGFGGRRISTVDLTLSTGAVIKINAPAGKFDYQLGDGAVISSYTAFKTAIGATGTNAASALSSSHDVITFTTPPDVAGNAASTGTRSISGTSGDDVLGAANDFNLNFNGGAGDDVFVITRFQYGDVTISDGAGSNLIKFDFGVTITDYDETSRAGGRRITEVNLTLSTGAVITIESPAGKFDYQLGDGTVIDTYTAFKTAIGASLSNADSTLAATHTVLHPTANFPTSGAVTVSSPALSVTIHGIVFTAKESGTVNANTHIWFGQYADADFVGFARLDSNVFGIHYDRDDARDTVGEILAIVRADSDATDNFIITTDASYDASANSSVLVLDRGDSYSLVQAPEIGTTLTAVTTGLTDTDDSALTFTYQWKLGDADITGATAKTYTPTAIGAYSVIVTAIDDVKNVNTAFTVTAITITPDIVTTGTVTITHAENSLATFKRGEDKLIFREATQSSSTATTLVEFLINARGENLDSFHDDYFIITPDYVKDAGAFFITGITLVFQDTVAYNGHKPSSGLGSGLVSIIFETRMAWADFLTLVGGETQFDLGLFALKDPAKLVDILGVNSVVFEQELVTGTFATGTVTLTHTRDSAPNIGDVLTAVTTNLTDADDSTLTFTYQWKLNGADITTGGTSATYTPLAIGDYTVTVTATDSLKSVNTDFTSATATTVVVADSVTTGTVAITHAETSAPTNAANIGEVLTAVTTNLIDTNDDALTFTYQWKLGGTNITGATSAAYTPTAIGAYTVTVIAIDSVRSVNTALTSTATTVVAANVEPTGAVTVTTPLSVNAKGIVFTAKAGDVVNAKTEIAFGNFGFVSFQARASENTFVINYNATDDVENTLGEIFALLQGQAGVTDRFTVTTGTGYDATASSVVLDTLNNGEGTFDAHTTYTLTHPPKVGTPTLGEVLTVNTSTIADADGLGAFTYQWLRGGEDISGATAATYTAVAADVDKALTVRVSYTDARGTNETVTSINADTTTAGTVTITHVENSKPTDAVNIGEILTAVTSGLSDADDSTLTFTYQWKLGGTDITGATAKTYAPTAIGDYSVVVTALDSVKNVNTAFTPATATTVVAANNAPTGAVTVTTPLLVNVEGLVFTAKAGSTATTIAFVNFPTGLNVGTSFLDSTLFISNNPSNAAFNTLGKIFALLQTQTYVTDNFVLTTGAGYDATANSAVLDTLDNGPGAFGIYSVFTLAEQLGTGAVLTADTSALTDADGLGAFSYQWLRGGAEISANATSSTYTRTADDVGKTITVRVSYTDAKGNAESVTSIVADIATVGAVSVHSGPTNAANTGEVLTAVTTDLTDVNDHELTFTYQWKLGGTDIATGGTGATYTPTAVGAYSVVVTAIDDVNNVNTAFTSEAFKSVNHEPTGAVTVSPVPILSVNILGLVFTLKAGADADADAETVIAFGNFSNSGFGVSLTRTNVFTINYNATNAANNTLGEMLALLQADTGVTNHFDVTTDVASYNANADSAVLDERDLTPQQSHSFFKLTAAGYAASTTLTADTSGITDVDGLTGVTFTYQWLRGGDVISGAESVTYKAIEADAGKVLTVRVSYTDGKGTTETLVSDTLTTGAVTITHAETSKPINAANTGEVLTADTSGLTDVDDDTLTFTYQWRLGTEDITGATDETYTPPAQRSYNVVVTATDNVNNVSTDFISTVITVVMKEPPLVDATGRTLLTGDASANTRGDAASTANTIIQGAGGADTLTSGTGSNVLIGGTGNDTINLKSGAGTDIVIHRFASGGTDWTNSDGADTITNFQRGIDKFVFTDIDGTAITNVADFLAGLRALPASGIEARVKVFDDTGGVSTFHHKIHKLEIRFGTSGDYLTINFSGDTGGANLITSDSVSSGLADTTNALIHTVTDFAIFDDLFGTGSFDVYATADLGVTIL